MALTPMMQQYMEIKERHKDSIVFFRLGDFYEMFFDDAILASKELEITLTGRECGQDERAPMCGVPFHSADSYISKLIEKGYKVAICEQVELPSQSIGIVKRDVVKIITPGTIIDTKVLDERSNNFLCCIYLDEKGVGIAYIDVSTGELFTTEVIGSQKEALDSLINELGKIKPREIIVNSYLYNRTEINIIKNRINATVDYYKDGVFDRNTGIEKIKKQFNVLTLEGYGVEDKRYSIIATGALLEYLDETQKSALQHINMISTYSINKYMMLDINTRRNLELVETIRDKNKKGSLLWLLDKTSTAMGGRLLKRWIEEPLVSDKEIEVRLDSVEAFIENIMIMDQVNELLKEVYDIERLVGKIGFGSCNGRDLISLKNSLAIVPDLKSILINSDNDNLVSLGIKLDDLQDIISLIEDSIVEDPPIAIKEGGIIKSQFNDELKELRKATIEGKEWLSKLEEEEKGRTGIKFLKVGYNKVFGYYLEVTKSNLGLVPDNYIRKQTLANSERYITAELKEMEAKILGAEDKMMELEYTLFIEIREKIKGEINRIQKVSKVIATIDTLNSLAKVAYKNSYVRPKFNDVGIIDIKNGRHPVVEKMLESELFVPNDTYLDNESNRIAIITGPNMAGKSTIMRQVAIITLMGQVGSFVPADNANISVVDRIFTRIGASDDLSQGQSTFMVEMSEVANLINNGTNKSLIILDEIGRGTSTYDGLSIAWSVIEHISNKEKLGAKTLFATHYHELTELENKIDGVKNYKILVKEKGEDIIFLRKIVRGSADRSYGIEVAKLAGVTPEVIERANEILKDLESRDVNKKEIAISMITDKKNEVKENTRQIDLFAYKEKSIIDKLKNIDIMKVTPIDAINLLYKLVEESKGV